MVKVMYNDKLVYKVVIWFFLGIILWKALIVYWESYLIK